tara:strand:- start:6336 stop:6452 length:117 start_codon:yes stop_codon:yes gene_type:complete
MQYHLHGFTPGDPAARTTARPAAPGQVDVLILGCGPAG